MTCQESMRLLPGYFDSELDLVHTLEIEDHLRTCAACTSTLEADRALRTTIARSNLRFSAPPNVVRNVRAAVVNSFPQEKSASKSWSWNWGVAATAAALIFCVFLMLKLLPASAPNNSTVSVAQEAIADHIRALMPGHLSDVESTDQHTVKPWFDGKLDFAPPVENFTAQGFPLIGGRLDYLDHHPAAALVYQRRKHFISVFLLPATDEPDHAESQTTERGYNVISWTRGAMNYWLVSDLNPVELEELAKLLQGEQPSAK
jgi:anti-sigma factor RsiW